MQRGKRLRSLGEGDYRGKVGRRGEEEVDIPDMEKNYGCLTVHFEFNIHAFHFHFTT